VGRRFEPVWAHSHDLPVTRTINELELGYISPVILQLLKLVRTGYPNRTGLSFIKVVSMYFWLGRR
jgi:hypothetical protein